MNDLQEYLMGFSGETTEPDFYRYEFHDSPAISFSADTLAGFIKELDSYVAGFEDDNEWDGFWGGSAYVHLWSKDGYQEHSPGDFIVGAYLATIEWGSPEFDMIYPRWCKPGAMGIDLDREEESVHEVYEFINEQLDNEQLRKG